MALSAVALKTQMATISLNENAPKDEVRFSFSTGTFDLEGSGTYDTESSTLIAEAAQHPWLTVTLPPVEEDKATERDMNDPHNNPSIDHLSAEASPEAVAAAEKVQEEIRAQVAGDAPYLVTETQVADAPAQDPQPAGVEAAPATAPVANTTTTEATA